MCPPIWEYVFLCKNRCAGELQCSAANSDVDVPLSMPTSICLIVTERYCVHTIRTTCTQRRGSNLPYERSLYSSQSFSAV